jgi:subtilisin-like proprotein convertase family protein
MKRILTSLLLVPALASTAATTFVQYSPNLPIPDGSSVGVADIQNVNSVIYQITSVTVSLNLSGGFNGDYYIYLTHGPGFTVLLNRVGRTTSNDFGYADSGFDATFNDAAVNGDIHRYQETATLNGANLIGTWAPDGRNVDPSLSLDTTPRNARLDTFNGMSAAGTWSIFAADLSQGSIGTLNSWNLTITGLPEPTTAGCLIAASAFLCRRRR